MTEQEQRRLVEEQFAIDYNCKVTDFENKDTVITCKKEHPQARKFEEDSPLSILSYRGKVLITADPELVPWCEEVLRPRLSAEWCMEVGTMMSIERKLEEINSQIDQSHIFFLPKYKTEIDKRNVCILNPDEIAELESDERIDEAFLFDDDIEDMVGVKILAADGSMLAVAGASNNSDRMWEMGANSFAEGKGFGQQALQVLIEEVQKQGKVPFCGTAMSHLASQGIALKAGMFPAFTEMRSVRK